MSGSALLVGIAVLLVARRLAIIQYIWLVVIPLSVWTYRLRAKQMSRLTFRESFTLADKDFVRKIFALKGIGAILLLSGAGLIIVPGGTILDGRSAFGGFAMVMGGACMLLSNHFYHAKFLVHRC